MYLGPSTRWFKVTAHLFPKGTLQVAYESDWWKGWYAFDYRSLRTDRWTDERTNKLITIEQGLNKSNGT